MQDTINVTPTMLLGLGLAWGIGMVWLGNIRAIVRRRAGR